MPFTFLTCAPYVNSTVSHHAMLYLNTILSPCSSLSLPDVRINIPFLKKHLTNYKQRMN